MALRPNFQTRLRWTLLVALAPLALGCGTVARTLSPDAPAVAPFDALAAKTPAEYYRPAEGLKGAALLTALHKIIKNHRSLGYDAARDVMFTAIDDPDDDDAVRDVYTGRLVKGVKDRGTAHAQEIDTEHTWPQSMGAKSVGRDDLHHLFPVDSRANSVRSNWSFGIVSQPTKILPDEAGDGQHSRIGPLSPTGIMSNTMIFEPRASHKGDVARAIFYFYTCYVQNERGWTPPSLENFRLEHDTLLRWHAEDPVTPAEAARNQAIYKAQGNRNPYVDHPEYVALIGRFIAKRDAAELENAAGGETADGR